MVWRRTGTIRWALFAALGFLALPVLASPYRGERFAYRQPDGEAITVRLWGDEFYAVEETEDGFVVTRDSDTGEFCYARLAPNRKSFVSSGIRVGRGNPEKNGIKPKERLDPGEVDRIQGQRRGERGLDNKGRFLNWGHGKKTANSEGAVMAVPGDGEGAGGSGIILGSPPANPTTNNRMGLTIMVKFPDHLGDAVMTSNQINNYVNQPGYSEFGNRGSIFDYFWSNSNGRLSYSNVVVDYISDSNNRTYYDEPTRRIPGRCPTLVSNLLNTLDTQGFNFRQCDADSNGVIDAVNVFYAGTATNEWSYGLWPHMSTINWTSTGGVKVTGYQLSDIGSQLAIGTFCHENGHLLCNFPDLYDYNDNLSEGLGNYCLMSTSTGWKQPPKPCVYLAYKAGWVDAVNLNSNSAVTVTARVDNATAWRYANPTNSKEYFMFEYRSSDQPGWEAGGRLPDCGLAVYHVDENGDNRNETNTPASHYECALIQADGLGSLEKNRNPGSPNDLYAWPDNRRLTDTTTPSAKWWDGAISRLDVNNVGPLGSSIVFNVGKAPSVQVASPVSPRTGGTTTTCRVVLEAITNAATSVRWQAVEMPAGGSVSFGSSSVTSTTATATGAGRYTIRCFAGNGSLEGFDDVVFYVGNNPSPVGHWRMDELSGNSVYDSSGNANTATSAVALAFLPSGGQLRGAVTNDGVTQRVSAKNSPSTANVFAEGGVFAIWIRPAVIQGTTQRYVVDKGNWFMALDHQSTWIGTLWFGQYFTNGTSTTTNMCYTERIIESNAWTHLALFYNSSNISNLPSLYANGRRVAVNVSRSPAGVAKDDSLYWTDMFGRWNDTGWFQGLADEVQMFASNLTARETADLALPLDFAPIVNAGTNAGIALRGGTNVYTMRGSAYDPEGDSMTYRWKQASGPGAAAFTNATLTNTMVSFSAVGTYVLRLEANDGDAVGFNEMTMVVTNALPTCSIAAPTNFHIAAEGMAVTVTVTCADADGIVTQVVYFADSIVLGRTTSAPHEFAWVNAAIGGHALQAAAYDDSGGVTTSATVSITVEVDTDHDGIPNSQDPDDDNDGMPDDWEIAYGLNPTNASATADSDSDGAPDYWEYIAGTVPTNPVSVLNILDLVLTNAPELKMRIQSVTARWYRLEFSTNLAIPDSWQHRTNQTLGTGNQITLTDTNTASNAVYRVRVWK